MTLDFEGEVLDSILSKDQAKAGVLEILLVGPLTRPEIETELDLIGKTAIATALKELVIEGTVRGEIGPHGRKTYSLVATAY